MTGKDRDRVLAELEEMLEGMVGRNCLSEPDCELILRAARNADDPEHAAGWASVLTHADPDGPNDLTVREIVGELLEQERPFSLGSPPERWARKERQLQRLRDFTPPPPRYERVGWLVRCLPTERRLRILDSPNRLLRESLRQGFPLLELDPQLQRGRLGGVSVLTPDKKRWTVILRAPSGLKKPRVHSIRGANGVAPDERARAAIADVVGKGIDLTHPSRRRWLAVGQVTIAGLGIALLLGLAPIEPPAPEILPATGVLTAGVGCYIMRHVLSKGSRRVSTAIFAVVWLGPAVAATAAIHAPIAIEHFHTAKPIGQQLLWLPVAYLTAALAWLPIGRWWHMRPGRRTKQGNPGVCQSPSPTRWIPGRTEP